MARTRTRAAVGYDLTTNDKSSKVIENVTKKFKQLDTTVGDIASGNILKLGLGTSAAAAAFTALYVSNSRVLDNLGKTSDRLGATVSGLQAMRDAGERAGIANNTLDTGLRALTRRLSEAAQGTGEAVNAIDELGLSARELNSLTLEDKFKAISRALEGVKDQGDKVRLSVKLFDTEAVDLYKVLADDIDDAAEAMDRLGIAFSRADIFQVEAANDTFQQISRDVTGVERAITVELAPAVNAIAEEFLALIETFGGAREVGAIMADSLVAGIGLVGDAVNFVRLPYLDLSALLTRIAIKAAEFEDFFREGESTPRLDRLNSELTILEDKISGITDGPSFSERLKLSLGDSRAASKMAAVIAELQKNLDELKKNSKDGVDLGISGGVEDKAFQRLVDSLKTGTEKIQAQYEKNKKIIDDEARLFPSKIAETTKAYKDIAAARDKALAELLSKTTAPSERAFNTLSLALADETERIKKEYETRESTILTYKNNFPKRAAEANALLIKVEEDQNEKLKELAEKRNNIARQSQISDFASIGGIIADIGSETQGLFDELTRRDDLLFELGRLGEDVNFGDIDTPEFNIPDSSNVLELIRKDTTGIVDELQERQRIINEFGTSGLIDLTNLSDFESGIVDALRTETADIVAEYRDREAKIAEFGELGPAQQAIANQLQVDLAKDLKEQLVAVAQEQTDALNEENLRQRQNSLQTAVDIGTAALSLLKKTVGDRIELNDSMTDAEKEAAEKQNAINRKKFEDNKKYSKGQAFINTALGITKALSTLDYGAAAAVAIAGLAQIRQIAGAQFGGSDSLDTPAGTQSQVQAPAITGPQPGDSPATGGGNTYYVTFLGSSGLQPGEQTEQMVIEAFAEAEASDKITAPGFKLNAPRIIEALRRA